MLQYSRRAKVAEVYLFKKFNDINVFVEDTVCRNVYEVLINRMLPEGKTIKKIFQLGGCLKVVENCKNYNSRLGPAIFIIDGDIGLLLGNTKRRMKNLYQLKVYSFENLVITKKAINNLCLEILTNKTPAEIKKIIKFDIFFKVIVSRIINLYILYAISHQLDLGIKTSSYNVTDLMESTSKGFKLSDARVQVRIKEVEDEIKKHITERELLTKIAEIKSRLPRSILKQSHFISGKTYLLPLIYHHLKNVAKLMSTKDQLMVRLARLCELNVDKGLPSFIQKSFI